MSYVKKISVNNPKPRKIVGFRYSDGKEEYVLVRNKITGVFVSVGYTTIYESKSDVLARAPDATPIYEGESITLQF